MADEGPKWTLVATFSGRMDAEMVAGILRSAGLHPRVQWESAAELFGLKASSLSTVQLYVPEDERLQARDLIRAYHGDDEGG